MEIIRSLKDFKPLKSSVLTIGSYDGIHRGHQKILSTLVDHSNFRKIPSVLVTFDPHPRHILDLKSKKLSLIMSINQKLEIINSLGVSLVYIINFTIEFSKITANEFLVNTIIKYFNPEFIIIGYNHHFGNKRAGSATFLEEFCKKQSIGLEVIKPILDDKKDISSSRIRQLIKEGFIRKVNFELGAVFSFNVKVVHGSGRGKNLNFPTANVIPVDKNQILPKNGVYFVKGRFIGLNPYGMCNFGMRPTFEENNLVMEIHFFHDKIDSLYGKEIRVEFLERIRDEKKFPTSEELVKQLHKDKQKCLELRGKYE